VKAFLYEAGQEDLFYLGQLKHRDLEGNCVGSQVGTSSHAHGPRMLRSMACRRVNGLEAEDRCCKLGKNSNVCGHAALCLQGRP
jgi:hypothetical protein